MCIRDSPDASLLRASLRLPELSQPELVRYYTALSDRNYGVDSGTYPLGSCTMKYNPKLNEAVAALAGFAEAHPLASALDAVSYTNLTLPTIYSR